MWLSAHSRYDVVWRGMGQGISSPSRRLTIIDKQWVAAVWKLEKLG
jgi:hypothetical protein